jgi:HlyD family secretion protein
VKIADTSAQDQVLEPKKNNKRIIILVISLIVVVILIYLIQPIFNRWSNSQVSVSEQRIRLAEVIKGDFIRDLSIQGRVVASISPRLYSPAQGTITFEVDAGDNVSKGQVLAKIESPELTNLLKQEQSALQGIHI